MYLQHFGLTEFPFKLTPDTSFYYATHSYQEALNTLLIAISSGEGFIKITGEVGTGKTLLCRKLLKSLGDGFKTAFIPNPYLDPNALLMSLATELGLSLPQHLTHHALLEALTQRLMQLAREDKQVVVCLDEVQAMPIETLEALRLLTNLETEKNKLLQVVIFGQPELEDKLNQPSIRQLRQRISFEYCLGALQWDELSFYLNHRMHVAGYNGWRVFTPASLKLLHQHSAGIPRLVNILAHKALLAAYGRGLREVTVREMRDALLDTHASVSAQHGWSNFIFKWWLALGVARATLSFAH
ncbi:MAG: AAA family ATPase [Methylophilaceae bacterium 17-44-8]|jgi:MSHA biogenesis protein MshM|nr:MAG: AAA family ATPase [Methylophilales bacterium 28-44-11]OZA06443.1 MAG: AAA family ATPase [Methylophilaceae bacterium 17-44-8]